MKSSTFSYLVAALSTAVTVLANDPQTPVLAAYIPTEAPSYPDTTPVPELVGEDEDARLEHRQATAINNGATAAGDQYPSVTTQWLNTVLHGGVTTWMPFVYIQTFAPTPDPLPGPIAGSIGLGTLSKNGKRDTAPEPTADADAGIAGRYRT